jgi:hypothetical protein
MPRATIAILIATIAILETTIAIPVASRYLFGAIVQ